MFRGNEDFFRKMMGRKAFFEMDHRIVDGLIGQSESSKMDSQAEGRFEIKMGLDGFRRIHMEVFHKPTGLISADRK